MHQTVLDCGMGEMEWKWDLKSGPKEAVGRWRVGGPWAHFLPCDYLENTHGSMNNLKSDLKTGRTDSPWLDVDKRP